MRIDREGMINDVKMHKTSFTTTAYYAICAKILRTTGSTALDRNRDRYHFPTYHDNDRRKLMKRTKPPSNHFIIWLSMLTVN